jgi:4-hydroxyproline epimerase
MQRVTVVDSHTAGEPTRVVVAGGPDLGGGPVRQQANRLAAEFDHFRAAVVREPRGSDVLVGALLCPPENPASACGVIFFNNVGLLGMCGHATIGLVVTLAHLGRLSPGTHAIETPVGPVAATLHPDGSVSFANVVSDRYRSGVTVDVPGVGGVTGDVAWGGNWFFLADAGGEELTVARTPRLTQITSEIRAALEAAGVTGRDGAVIDHIELVGPPRDPANHARNFVLCPGLAYDRSPCGTGTSAKLACLAAAGKLAPGEVWRQEGVLGTVFTGSYEPAEGGITPTVAGRAYVTAEATLLLDEADPFRWGI